MKPRPMMSICMGCRPGVRSLPGVTLSHGYCRRHELEAYERGGMISPLERVELWARRWLTATLCLAAAFTSWYWGWFILDWLGLTK